MNSNPLSKWQILILFLLISQSYRFVNANDDDDDEGNLFAKKKLPSKVSQVGDEARQSIRDYLDLLCINWNGFFISLGDDTPHTRRVLVGYLRDLSAVYARVLQLHDHNGDEVSRAIYGQFLEYIVPRMRDVTHFDMDSPIRDGPAVVQYIEERVVINQHLRQRRWSHPSNDRPRFLPPFDGIVPNNELEHMIFLRVPFPGPPPEKRPPRPWGDNWQKVINPESWPGLHMRDDMIWNHLVPYAEVRSLFENYYRLWLQNNRGNVWYSQATLIWLEIRLAMLVILRADLSLGVSDAAEILRGYKYYIERGKAWNMWSAGNLFIGPRDQVRHPEPSQVGPERFEIQAAKAFKSEKWALAGYRLTRDILNFKSIPKHEQDLRDILKLYQRYVRLLQESGSDELWVQTGQGVEPADASDYDVHERQLSPRVYQHFKRIVSEDIRHNEQRILVAREYARLRQDSIPETIIHDTIDRGLKPGGDLYKQLEPVRKEKLNKKIDEFFKQIKISRYIFSGPKDSSNWTVMQKTSVCLGKKLNIPIKTCDRNILFDPYSPSTSSGSYSPRGSTVFSFDNLVLVEHDSGVESGTSSRRPSEIDEFCGATRDHRNMLIDPSIVSNPPPDFSSLNEANTIDEDFYDDTVESLQDAALDRCFARENPDWSRRNKRNSLTCSEEIVQEAWNRCKNEIKV